MLWLALGSGEEDGEEARRAALRSAAQADSSAGTDAATPPMASSEKRQRVVPGRSFGSARTASPRSSEVSDLIAGAPGETLRGGSRRIEDAGRPDSADDPDLSPELSSRYESAAAVADADGEAPERSEIPSEALLLDLEAKAARVAERLGLLDPVGLERRVDLAVRGDLSYGELEPARDAARRSILADAAIVEDLVQARYGENASSRGARDARGMGQTLLSGQNPA